MEEKERLPIDTVLDKWLAKYGEEKRSERGTVFYVIPIPDRITHLLNLIQALSKYGYSEEEIRSGTITAKVVKKCWSDLITKIPAKRLRENRDITRRQWDEAINRFFVDNFDFPEYKKPEKIEPKKSLEIEPKDRIKMDTSDVKDAPLDLDFLKELGIEESSENDKDE